MVRIFTGRTLDSKGCKVFFQENNEDFDQTAHTLTKIALSRQRMPHVRMNCKFFFNLRPHSLGVLSDPSSIDDVKIFLQFTSLSIHYS